MLNLDKRPDAAARFEAHLNPILGPAYGAALQMLGRREDAEDAVQEAALTAFRAFASFQEGTHFKAWFFKILTHLILNRKRKQGRETVPLGLDSEEEELTIYHQSRRAGLHAARSDPAAQVLGKIETEDVVAAIESLPEEYRIVSSLFFMGSFSYQEIAEMIECPIGTVRSRLNRGRRLLQKALWAAAADRGIVSRSKPEGR